MNSFFGEEGFLANPFFLETVVNKENFSLGAGKNYFTVIAPTFGEANDMTLYTIAFLMYMDELAKATKRESGRDSKSIILDVVYSYGGIHNWPEEILGAESAVKMGIVKDISEILGLETITCIDMRDLEQTEEWKQIEKMGLEEFNIPTKPEDINSARQTSYDTSVSDEQLDQENQDYGRKRWTEFTYMTKVMNAWTIKQSRPQFDETYDVCLGQKNVPRIYVQYQLNSKIFRPKKDEPSFFMPEKDLKRITGGFDTNSEVTTYLATIGSMIVAKKSEENPVTAANCFISRLQEGSVTDEEFNGNLQELLALQARIRKQYKQCMGE